MIADEMKLLQAYVDGELDPGRTLELEARLSQNAQLRSTYERLRDMSAAIRDKADYHAAPQGLAARIGSSLPDEPREGRQRARRFLRSSWLRPMAALAAAVVLGLGIGTAVMRPDESEMLAREVIASHVRATLSARLIDVASSDQHTVKPWLGAHLPFSPPVADFSGEGYTLAGARLEYIAGKPVAVLVYKRRQHTIDLYAWPGKALARAPAEKYGFNVERFSAGGLQYWAVSDLNRQELEDFARLISGRS